MSRMRRLGVVLGLNLALVAGLVAVGLTAHSVAVFAEGGDYLLDAVGVAVAMFAIWLSGRPSRADRLQGRWDPNSVAALVNAGWLLALELIVVAAAVTGVAVAGAVILLAGGLYWLDPADQ